MKFAIVDIETTGDKPKNFKVIEIAIILHDGRQELETYHTFVDPQEKVNPFISRLTGITDNDLIGAPKFFEIAKKIVELTKDTIFVAHNVSFDYGVLRNEYKRLGYDYRLDHLDTVQTARIIFPGHDSYGLKNIAKALGIPLTKHHRAIDDTKATAILFQMLYEKDTNNLNTFIKAEINPKLLNPYLKLEEFDDIPNKVGIYKFYNEARELIYIGKSIHIKKRVEQHLKNTKTQKALEMRTKIASIEHELTGSELVALLRESEEIKKNQPFYNRSQRTTTFSHGLYLHVDQNGYKNLHLKKVNETGNPIMTFTSLQNGKNHLEFWLEKHRLCQRLCHLHQSSKACFNYSIKKCEGACIGLESSDDYNKKVDQLIAEINFNQESFLILDKGRNSKEYSIIWIEKGQYKGYGYAFRYLVKRNPIQAKKYIALQATNRDFQSIIKSMLYKNDKLEIIKL